MEAFNRSSDHPDRDSGDAPRKYSRSLGPIFLLAGLSLAVVPPGYYPFVISLLALVCLVLSIVFGVLARQWILVYVVVGTTTAVMVVSYVVLHRGHGSGRNDSAAMANLRTINTAEITYLSSAGTYGAMTDLIDARLLDDTFTGTKAGYNYTITLDNSSSSYTARAVPASIKTGRYGYFSVPEGCRRDVWTCMATIRYSTDASLAPAGQSGRPVQ